MSLEMLNGRISFGKVKEIVSIPDLTAVQRKSYERFLQYKVPPDKRINQGLEQVFREVFPIISFNEKLVLEYVSYSLAEPKYTEEECRERDATYAAPLKVKTRLVCKETMEVREQDVYMREIPVMTSRGTFIINGAERVIVSQLHRSPGIFYTFDETTRTYSARFIPYWGTWIEFEVDVNNIVIVRLARRRKLLATTFLRALGYSTNQEIIELFYPTSKVETISDRIIGFRVAEDIIDSDTNEVILRCNQKIKPEILTRLREVGVETISILDIDAVSDDISILNTLDRDDTSCREEAILKAYTIIRPGEPTILDNAVNAFERLFSDSTRYNLGLVGRYKINKKLKLDTPLEVRTLTKEDIVAAIKRLIRLHVEHGEADDIDHLGNRRVRSVGELLQNHLRIGFTRLEKGIQERMAIQDPDTMIPQTVINIKPVTAAINEFFGSSQLSQFMDQTNPLAELTHKRRLSALGQGGLSKERAGFEVRDVHHTHYGRICPIETPEGPNIGLIVSLSTYAQVDEYGFIEIPYRKVINGKATREIKYLRADDEEESYISPASTPVDSEGKLTEGLVSARHGDNYPLIVPEQVNYMDVSFKQLVSVSTALIPFLEHDDANRALMGSNMQRQAVPLLKPEPPLVGTGMEGKVACDSGSIIISDVEGIAISVTGDELKIKSVEGEIKEFKLRKFKRSNQGTCLNQTPIIRKGDQVKAGQPLTEGTATAGGELALGSNILVAFMPWEGYNFEDAILISERLVREDVFSSIHIERFEVEARDTQLGQESITRDIPNLGEEALKDLDKSGIVRIGAHVRPGNILVGKVTPKGETDLSPEYKLLHSIFGEKAREVRDSSLRVPYGKEGIVIDVKVFSQEARDDLPSGVEKMVQVYVAKKRKISVGDKIAGRHGNKGVIARILPDEDMPFMADGTAADMVLNPLSVPSRMNLGQIMETHLGWAAHVLGTKYASPVFDGATEDELRAELKRASLPEHGKINLYDGRTGEKFEQKVTVGYIYIMKLAHLVEDKIHARSTGPYSLVTQQPLGGKAQFGGQRLGEMEVWALEAYGAAYTLQELLTVKSDDIVGRAKVYEAIIKGKNARAPGIPESFNVLSQELRGLALDIEVLDKDGKPVDIKKLDEMRRMSEEPKIASEKLLGKREGRQLTATDVFAETG
ncbi:MAG: DNA-directed RNA polymerase subunit beta [bacterium]|nr:DNA-directed RNA polymerase subunit beta [bacterium]